MSATFTASFAVVNVCGNPVMPIEDATADMLKVAALGADVTAGVEIGNRDYKRAWRKTFKASGIETYNLGCECPVSTALPVRRAWIRKLHSGLARVTPARFNSVVRLDRTGVPVLVIAKHPVSGWDRQGANAARTFNMSARKAFHAVDQKLTAGKVRRAHRKGVSVVVMGDLNTVRGESYADTQIEAAQAGLMWIIALPAPGVTVELGRRLVLRRGLHTDHAAILRELTFTKH